MELLLCSLVGCNQATAMTVNARKTKLPIESITYKALGTYDARGFFGIEGVSPAYQTIKVVADVIPHAGETISQADLDSLAGYVGARCPVEALFKNAGVPLDVTWRLGERTLNRFKPGKATFSPTPSPNSLCGEHACVMAF